MLSPTTNSIFFSVIVLLSIATSVCGIACSYSEVQCFSYSSSWCCSSDETCGSNYGSCRSSTNPATIIIITVVLSVFCCIVVLSCCIHSQQRQQRLRTAYTHTNSQVNPSPYQQQIHRSPIRVVHVCPVYNVGGAPSSQVYPSIYQAPPPSYEVATAGFPSVHSSPPTATNFQQSN